MDTLIVNCMEYILENQLNSYRTFRRYVESYASGCRTVVALIRRRAALSPAAVAVVDKTSALSYEELDRQSDALAIRLRQNGVGAGKYVGIMLPRTKEYIVAILATLKAGGTYVPLDAACLPKNPPQYDCDAVVHELPDHTWWKNTHVGCATGSVGYRYGRYVLCKPGVCVCARLQ